MQNKYTYIFVRIISVCCVVSTFYSPKNICVCVCAMLNFYSPIVFILSKHLAAMLLSAWFLKWK